MTTSSKDHINLNDYLEYLPAHKRKGYQVCPVCDGKLAIDPRNGKKFTCYSSDCDRGDIRRKVLELAGESQDWQDRPDRVAKREERDRKEREAKADRIAGLITEDRRDRQWQGIIANSFLSDRHKQDMLDRGWTPEQIEKSNARSSARGRIIPIQTASGLYVGAQVITAKGKRWYTAGANRLRETDELPLTVVYPKNPIEGFIAITESVCDKPHRCADLLNMVTIGSSNIGSQPLDLKRSIATIKERMGWNTVILVLMPDGGAVSNLAVMANYRKLNQQLTKLRQTSLVGWWGQVEKGNTDIDEIDPATPIQRISFAEFEAIARSHNGLLNRFFRQFRPKKERIKPTPAPTEITDAIEYNSPAEQQLLLQQAIDKGFKVVLDLTHAGGFKSTTAAQIDGLKGINKYIYITGQHRNPTTAEVEDSFIDFPSRNKQLYVDPDHTTPNGNPYLKTSQPQGADWQTIAGNCHQADLQNALTKKGYDLNGQDNRICAVCPQLNACHFAIGSGYGYKHARRAAMAKSRIRAHPQSLPHPEPLQLDDPGSYINYSESLLTWDDEKVKTQKQAEATEKDFHAVLTKLAVERPELLPSIAPIIAKLKSLYERTDRAYYGQSHAQIVDGIGEIDRAVLDAIDAALTPDFEDLIQECDGIDTIGMAAKDRRAVKAADRLMAQQSKRENSQRVTDLPTNWLVSMLEVIIDGQGYLRFDGTKLIVTQPDKYHQQIVKAARLSVFLDATGNREDLARSLGIAPDEVMVIRKPQPTYPNLQISQVVGLGTPRKDRSSGLLKRISALKQALTDLHLNLGTIDWNREDGAGLWFADSRGTNRYKDCDALILIGSPCPNLGAMAAEFSILYGYQVDPTSDDLEYRAFISRKIEAEIVQAIARLRAHLNPDQQKTIYLVADRDDLPLDKILGHYPDCGFDQIQAIDIAVESATPKQRLRHKVATYLIKYGIATQAELAKAVECSQSRISQLFSQLGTGWRKLLLVLYKALNRGSNNYHTSAFELVNWEQYIEPDVIEYVQTSILGENELSDTERAAEVVNLATLLTIRQFEALVTGLGEVVGQQLIDLLATGIARIPITDVTIKPQSVVPA